MSSLVFVDCLLPAANRPPIKERKFSSPAIEKEIARVKSILNDPVLALMFEQDFPNTLDTTIYSHGINKENGRHDTFVITGDIEAMWQRDSTNQVLPYLRFMKQDINLELLILGVINRQIQNVLLDAYSNAYTQNTTSASPWVTDSTTKLSLKGKVENGMVPGIWERKFEIDSIAAVLKLQVSFYETASNRKSFIHEDYFASLRKIRDVLTEQQLGTKQENLINRVPYTFQREADNPTDTTSHGRGNLSSGKDGMVKSFFRPSDDACTYAYFIPGNAMLVTYLNRTSQMIKPYDSKLSQELKSLSESIKRDIYSRGITTDNKGNKVFAYEIDGFGNQFKMDDSNIPNLLSLPYLEFIDKSDPIYINTRKLVLDSNQNPYFFEGLAGKGIGGPHAGDQFIWPMSLITQAITSDNDAEILACLDTLKTTTNNTYFMHEAFQANNAENFTRPWFAWANTFFGELILHLLDTKPHLLTNVSEQAQSQKQF